MIQDLKFDSDHRMVKATVGLNKKIIRNRQFRRRTLLPRCIDKSLYKASLESKLLKINWSSNNTQTLYDIIESSITNAAKETEKKNKDRKKSKLSEEALTLLSRRELLKRHRFDNDSTQKEFAEVNKLTKRKIRTDLRNKKIQTIKNIMDSTKSIKAIRKETDGNIIWIEQLKSNSGRRVTTRSNIVKTATDFYRSIYKSTLPNVQDKIRKFIEDTKNQEEQLPPIIQEEVEEAIGKQKCGKSPGEDGILNDYLKIESDVLVKSLATLFNNILKNETIPAQWKTNNIILLHKKGPREDVNNYRPITLMSNIYKTFSSVITKRITSVLDESQPCEQAGFRTGFSTIDHLQTLNQLIEKTQEFNRNLYLVFIDFAKAFDSVEQLSVLKALQRQGVHRKYIRIIGKLYLDNKATIKLDKKGEEFSLQRGVRQGDPISPKLFTAVLEEIFRKMKQKYGVNIDGKKLFNLRFADDIVLLSESHGELNKVLSELAATSKEVGLTMNMKKTKIMTNGVKKPIKIENEEIEYIDEYIYLGQLISFENKSEKEITRRISSAWKQFWSLKFVLLEKSISMKIKKHVMDTCILPTLLYGAQTWSLSKKEKSMLNICQRRMERKILGITLRNRVRNTEIRSKTQIKDAAETAIRLKWKWAGHVLRLKDDRWNHRATIWDQRRGKRKVGRQRIRWEDEFKKRIGTLWTRTAKKREEWKVLVNGSH